MAEEGVERPSDLAESQREDLLPLAKLQASADVVVLVLGANRRQLGVQVEGLGLAIPTEETEREAGEVDVDERAEHEATIVLYCPLERDRDGRFPDRDADPGRHLFRGSELFRLRRRRSTNSSGFVRADTAATVRGPVLGPKQ